MTKYLRRVGAGLGDLIVHCSYVGWADRPGPSVTATNWYHGGMQSSMHQDQIFIECTNSKPRLMWVDSARGIAICLVVINHALMFLIPLNLCNEYWIEINNFLRTMRMPLFFFTSGLFATSWVIQRSWREMLRRKVLLFAWLYALWVSIRYAYFSFVPQIANPDETESIIRYFAQAVWSNTDTWFIYALAVFFVLAKATNHYPLKYQLAISAGASIIWLTGVINLPSALWNGLPSFYVFFLVASHLSRSRLNDVLEGLGIASRSSFVAAWIAFYAAVTVSNFLWIPPVGFAVRVVAVAGGLVVALSLVKLPWIQYLGRNTLPIYLTHTIWLGGITAVVTNILDISTLGAWIWLLPVPLAVAGLLTSLGFWKLSVLLKLAWLFNVPNWLDRICSRCGKFVSSND